MIARAVQRARRVVTLPRRLLERAADRRERARFREAVLRTRPLPVAADSDVELHLLFGAAGLLEALATAKSLIRYMDDAPPAVVVHEDGSLGAPEIALLSRHLPGARVVRRAEADARVLGYLDAHGLKRCAELRRTFIMSMKLFDAQLYGDGRAVLYADSDILFLQRPETLLSAWRTGAAGWTDRYNEDVRSSYSWSEEAVQSVVGVKLPPRFNAGMICFRRPVLGWEVLEECLSLPMRPEDRHFVEQTLQAIDFTLHGARPLPPDYDVCFRHTWRGDDYDRWLRRAEGGHLVSSQHYCGSPRQRAYFYSHFNEHVAGALR